MGISIDLTYITLVACQFGVIILIFPVVIIAIAIFGVGSISGAVNMGGILLIDLALYSDGFLEAALLVGL